MSLENSPTLDDQIVTFLRRLANSMERKQLKTEQMKRVGEFFMSYHFWENADRDVERTETEKEDDEFSYEEFMKFLFLGWYVYCVILKNESL